MIKVNSLSGGKTSSYIAVHYPADYDVFALVHVRDDSLTPNDAGLVKRVSDKIGKQFIGTVESDKTLKVVLDLEQKIGREITWVCGISFDELINQRKAIPNKIWRFCTTEMKMKPIFKWWYQNISEVCEMRIGFRLDEFQRSMNFSTTMKYRKAQKLTGEKRYEWDEIEWRKGSFPLIDDAITHKDIQDYWNGKDLDFPLSSNCVGCFWKSPQELRQNWDNEPEKMEWFDKMEKKMGNQFRTDISMNEVKLIGKQQAMFFGGGSCHSKGYCTD